MVGSSSYQQESLEKTVLAVVHSARKFPHYFQEHTIVVITQLLLRTTLRSTDYAGKIAKWSTVLGASDIKYMPRTLVKELFLAGLVAQFTKILIGERSRESKYGWKIGWHNFPAKTSILEGIYWYLLIF